MYGGLGDDFMHGGGGDDAVSGAEAQAQWYNDKPVGASFFTGLFTVSDPTNPLGYNATTTKFAAYDNSTSTSAMKKINNFFLNFDATVDGTAAGKIFDGTGNDTVDASGVTNGAPVIFFSAGGNDTLRGGNGPDSFVFAASDLTTLSP